MGDTREQLLDAAERLFAERGIDSVSLREITTAAEANVAAVNYHFGSKENLVRQVIARRMVPLNVERLRLLDEFDAALPEGSAATLQQVLYAFVHPVMEMMTTDPATGTPFVRLMVQVHGDMTRRLPEMVVADMGQTIQRFVGALSRALPELDLGEIMWRAHFATGAMAHTASAVPLLEAVSQGACRFTTPEELSRRLVAFLTAGFQADPAQLSLENKTTKKKKGVRE